MTAFRQQRSPAGSPLAAILACLAVLAAAAPAAVRAESMNFTRMHRGAPVTELRTVVRADPAVVNASIAALIATPARGATFAATAASSPQPATQQLDAAAPSSAAPVASIALGGCPRTNFFVPLDVSYTGTINVILDSGSADLAVASSNCDSSCAGIPGSFPYASPGDTGFTGQLDYGTAMLVGEVFTEAVQLPDLPPVNINMLAITSQTGLLNPVACDFSDTPEFTYSGILGFGPDETSQLNTDGSITGILAAAGVPKIFAPALCPEGGRLYFGGYDGSVLAAPPVYTPLFAAGDYEQADGEPLYAGYLVEVLAMSMGGQDLGLDSSNQVWLADTGTNGLSLPPVVAANAAALLNGPFEQLTGLAGFFSQQDCTNPFGLAPAQLDAALPTLDLTFPSVDGTDTFTGSFLPSSLLQVYPYDGGMYAYCPFGVSDEAANAGANILPNTMMVGSMLIFDQVNSQLGFASLTSDACTTLAEAPDTSLDAAAAAAPAA